jgi:hypothetical protein
MRCKLVRRATAFIPDMCRLGRFIDELVSFALLGLGYGGTDGKAFRGQIWHGLWCKGGLAVDRYK